MHNLALLLVTLWLVTMPVSSSAQTGIDPIVITPIASVVGDQVTVLGSTYQITEMEFVRYDTDEVYIIKFPALNQPAVLEQPGQQLATISTQWVADSNTSMMSFPNQVLVSGFPAGAVEFKGSSHTFSHIVVADLPLPGNINVSYHHNLVLSIAVGPETIVNVTFSYNTMQEAEATIDNLIDAVPVVDVIARRDERILEIQQLRTLLNYIEIRVKSVQP